MQAIKNLHNRNSLILLLIYITLHLDKIIRKYKGIFYKARSSPTFFFINRFPGTIMSGIKLLFSLWSVLFELLRTRDR